MFVAPGTTTAALTERLAGRRWPALRPVLPDDEPQLHALEMTGELAWAYRHRGVSLPAEGYHQSLWAGVTTQLAIVDPGAPGVVLGSACMFGYDQRNGVAQLAFALTPPARAAGWPAAGVLLFLQHLFTVFPLRFLLGEVLEFNLPHFASALPVGLAESLGSVPEAEYHDGRYWDRHLLRITRPTWTAFVAGVAAVDRGELLQVLDDCLGEDRSIWLDQPLGELPLDSLAALLVAEVAGRELDELVGVTPRQLVE